MSGSLTVIGGHSGNTLTGLVSVPISFLPGTLQTTLTSLSTAVTGGIETLNNSSVVGGPVSSGLLELSNFDSSGASTGNYSINATVPAGYNTLIVEVAGSETLTGNGTTDLALFGSNSTVNYTEMSGSGSIYASGNDNILADGTNYYAVGGTIGGNAFNILSNTGSVTTEGGSNTIFIAGLSDTVYSGGSNDLIASAATLGSTTVAGFANFIGLSGSNTITAVGTGSINAFIDTGYSGKLYFINDSSSASTITGLAGTVTVFAGAGGGHYEGGALGNNYLVGGFSQSSLDGGAGLVTLVGSTAGNDTLIAAGSVSGAGFNVINAGGQNSLGAVTTSGNDVLQSTSTAGSTYFTLNEGNDLVTASGGGTQYVTFNTMGSATVVGSNEAIKNQFYLSQDASQGGATDMISNFNFSRDNFSLVNSPDVTISGVANNQTIGGDQTGAIINLSNGTRIELVNVSVRDRKSVV